MWIRTGTLSSAGRRPERIEPRIVDRDQLPLGVAQAQPERLPDLQAARAERHRLAQALRLRLAKTGIGREVVVVDPGEDGEAVRIGLLVAGELGPQAVAPAAIEVDDGLHAGFVHRRDELADRAAQPVVAPGEEGVAEVIVRVDDREARLGELVAPRCQHRPRFVLAQEQIDLGAHLSPLRVIPSTS